MMIRRPGPTQMAISYTKVSCEKTTGMANGTVGITMAKKLIRDSWIWEFLIKPGQDGIPMPLFNL